jgi:predicted transcriptional regulator
MRKTEIRVESGDLFFERGRKLAKAANRGDRSAVTRDVRSLERLGVIQAEIQLTAVL